MMLQICVLKKNRQWILSFSLICLLELCRLLEQKDKNCICWTESIEMMEVQFRPTDISQKLIRLLSYTKKDLGEFFMKLLLLNF